MQLFEVLIELKYINKNVFAPKQLAGGKTFFVLATSKEDAIKKTEQYTEYGLNANGVENTEVVKGFYKLISIEKIKNFIS